MAEREEITIDETLDRNIYPPVNFHFRALFEGKHGDKEMDSGWQEVTGFANEIGVEDLNEGGENRFSYRLPNRGKYSNLVLKRGVKINSQLVDWIQKAINDFVFEPLEVSVYLLNVKHEPLISWKFHRAYPVKWSTSDLKGQDNAIVIETLELAYLGFTKTYHQPPDNKS